MGCAGGGLAFTSLLGAFLLIITGRAIIIEQLMIERTTQLKASKRLEAIAKQRRDTAASLAEVGRLLSQSLDSLEVGPRGRGPCPEAPAGPSSCLISARAHLRDDGRPRCQGQLRTRCYLMGLDSSWDGGVGLAVHTRQPVVTADVLADPRIALPAAIRADLGPSPVRAVLALPLMRDSLVIGALSIGDESGRVFDEEAIELARLFADQASSALANAQLYAEVQAARERLQGLSRQLLEAQEAERRRIAHELHDEAGQLLVFVHTGP